MDFTMKVPPPFSPVTICGGDFYRLYTSKTPSFPLTWARVSAKSFRGRNITDALPQGPQPLPNYAYPVPDA